MDSENLALVVPSRGDKRWPLPWPGRAMGVETYDPLAS